MFCYLFFLLAHAGSIAIFTAPFNHAGDNQWDPASIQTGITGSEEAVIYLSEKLAHLGYRVVVYADIPAGSPYFSPSANPRFVPFDFVEEQLPYDIGIAWRQLTVAKQVKNFARKAYLWPHDVCEERTVEPNVLEAFDGVLWLSESQKKQWISIHPCLAKFNSVFGNGINPEQFGPILERQNPYSCIYASGYNRGLKLLLDIWPTVKKHYPKATLDLYYGWGKPETASSLDKIHLEMKIRSLEFLGVKEHGLVGHDELHRAYEKASFWTYPCTNLGLETFCISALKAQFSGAVPVIISGSALEETVQHGFRCFKGEDYLETLLYAMSQSEKIPLKTREEQRRFILEKYTWEKIASSWKELFDCDD